MNKRWVTWQDLFYILISAALYAISFVIFVFPNQFAPAGLPGIETMIQEKWGFPVSTMNILVNIPLVILTFCLVDKGYAIRSAIYSVCLSVMLYLMQHVDLSMFIYQTENSAVLAPLAGGVLCGFSYAIVFKRGSCTGGTDLVAALVHRYRPEQNMIWILFTLNASVAALSYFVYGYQLEPVILCLIYCFVTSKVSDVMLKGFKEAIKFEIVTEHPDKLAKTLIEELGHGVTEIPAVGSFTRQNKTLLICVVNKHQIVQFQRILERFPNTFAYLHTVKETMGIFVTRK